MSIETELVETVKTAQREVYRQEIIPQMTSLFNQMKTLCQFTSSRLASLPDQVTALQVKKAFKIGEPRFRQLRVMGLDELPHEQGERPKYSKFQVIELMFENPSEVIKILSTNKNLDVAKR